MKERDNTYLVWAIVVIAFAIRLIVTLYFHAYRITDGWQFGWEMGRVAKSLAEGHGFSGPFVGSSGPSAWVSPVYPLILAAIFKAFGIYSALSGFVALLFNAAVSAATCGLLYHLGARLFGKPVGLLAAGLHAVYPPSIWHSVNSVWDTTLLAAATVILLLAFYRLRERESRAGLFSFGFLIGATVLLNPVVLSFGPVLFVWVSREMPGSIRRKTIDAVLAGAVSILVISPWLIRNYIVFGEPMLRSNFGVELKVGNSPSAERAGVDMKLHPSMSESELRRYNRMGEVAYSRACQREAVAFIGEHPWMFTGMVIHRVRLFWFGAKDSEWKGNIRTQFSLASLKQIVQIVPLTFALIGLLIALKRRLPIGPILVIFALFPIVYYLTHTLERYRYPVEPLLVLLSASAFWEISQEVGNRLKARVKGGGEPPQAICDPASA